MKQFELISDYAPSGDQPEAIRQLADGVLAGDRFQTLKGVTGSGKTFTMANIIQAVQKPTLIISHNKTLAAQLYREFKGFFPHNAVEYFVSYYDYYQPEAYVPARDLYIEKDASINDEIDRLRLSATFSLMERRDVIVVSTVSCIYGLGLPESWRDLRITIEKGQTVDMENLKRQLVSLQYERNDAVLERGRFRLKGDVLEVFPAYMEEAYRIEFDWEEIVRIRRFHPISGEISTEFEELSIYPAKHFVLKEDAIPTALVRIRKELDDRLAVLRAQNKLLEAERLKTRTEYDIEMLSEMGYCPGIENYSAPIANRKPGEPPATLFHYFPKDFLLFMDESHVTFPQVGAMYEGDRSRKQNLVDFGFRLPCALDNRPLKINEFESMLNQAIFVSATPGPKEIQYSTRIVEQLIRPTGLLDPILEVHKSEGQMEDIYREIQKRIVVGERSLILTLTKKMAEDLTDYLLGLGLKVKYIHSEIETIERVEILKGLRAGEFDVLIGINLLREGIDLPEVSFIGILDADKIGFLRSTTSLIQIVGRAARNENGKVIMYADRISDAMRETITETERRRSIQQAYNAAHGITPKTIKKAIEDILVRENELKKEAAQAETEPLINSFNLLVPADRKKLIKKLEQQMSAFADELRFEEAAAVRDKIEEIKRLST
ncbi:excinuclease ABC subunit B [Treponema phagedenis]|uniref:UvrABC system protein B n=1 Tax=Treponema phagedenis TaxID=162 RepID=A0A0B7GWA5_TREPH|nr:excinuclease ABC subunit UvrB [Treponema phagedenis]NVP25249.1 excinuclease ABC subunit B [Treponema phagedenis]QEJ93905.1 excinuclease ABC subunit B [Treponema phagedenis]QEJ97077.1 excinuclease ABC subunit B [Treponema phagedenis]QEK02087.1 excinuclease ABC subunit B [Treponema phagedenis]QEK02988.1 excinuclease ABC subunit B [Treponema phagedenis]